MSTLQREHRIAEAVAMREAGRVEEARRLLLTLHEESPDDAEVNLQCAWTHDKLGLEQDAVPFYEAALQLGLNGEDLKDALLGLGSTYRTLGRYDKALAALTRGVEAFPDSRSMQVFRAMSLYNKGRAKEACQVLLQIISETTDDPEIRSYKSAIDTYAADLDRTWS